MLKEERDTEYFDYEVERYIFRIKKTFKIFHIFMLPFYMYFWYNLPLFKLRRERNRIGTPSFANSPDVPDIYK